MNEIKIDRYRHYKGNEYTVIGMAQHSETLEELVVIARSMANTACGCAPSRCSLRR
jgi:hypothetical protein